MGVKMMIMIMMMMTAVEQTLIIMKQTLFSHSIHTLKRELFELGCNEEKYSSLLLLVADPLNKMTPSTRITFQPQTMTVIESNRQV